MTLKEREDRFIEQCRELIGPLTYQSELLHHLTMYKDDFPMPIKVSSTIDVREIDGTELGVGSKQTIQVHSHWHRDEMVVLEIEGKRLTISGRELTVAIQNAMRTK